MLQQGLHFEVIFTFNLDRLRRSSGGASRGVLLQLRDIEDIVDLLEPTLKVKAIGHLSYSLQHPEWSYKPSSELPSTCKIEGSSRRVAFLRLPGAPTARDTY